jgi:hypothetical protein
LANYWKRKLPSIVYEHVESPEAIDRCIDGRLTLRLVRDIELDRPDIRAVLRYQFVPLTDVVGGRDDLVSGGQSCLGKSVQA